MIMNEFGFFEITDNDRINYSYGQPGTMGDIGPIEPIQSYGDINVEFTIMDMECFICAENNERFYTLPCNDNHMVCENCISELQDRKCPFCKRLFNFPIRTNYILHGILHPFQSITASLLNQDYISHPLHHENHNYNYNHENNNIGRRSVFIYMNQLPPINRLPSIDSVFHTNSNLLNPISSNYISTNSVSSPYIASSSILSRVFLQSYFNLNNETSEERDKRQKKRYKRIMKIERQIQKDEIRANRIKLKIKIKIKNIYISYKTNYNIRIQQMKRF